jgi:hypothetical protein
MKTIEDILMSRNELEKMYLGDVALHLWRGVRQGQNSVLHPELKKRDLGRGRVRQADVETYSKNGSEWVRSKLGMGISLLDRPNTFIGREWEYFFIPKGTIIPIGLIITKDHFIQRYNATHYSVSPNFDMPSVKYIQLLDQLALNARQRQKEVVNG